MSTNTRQLRLRSVAVHAIICATAGAFPALAQDNQTPDAEERREETIVVTGSYVPGTSEEGVLPVDVFSTAELEAAGLDSPLEFIKSLPSVGGVLGDSNQFAAGSDQGVGSINLRSLGRERTLVLFNGRRTIVTPGDGAADTQLIPMFALERIEVLKDGAASTYGSDAIAGVANFVTKSDFDGLELKGDYAFIDGSDGDYQASILAGKSLDRANFMVGFGYQHRSELPTTERDFTQVPYKNNPTGYSALSNPALYTPRLGDISQGDGGLTLGLGVDGQLVDTCASLGGVNGVFPISATVALPVCRYSYVPFDNLVEEEDRYQVYAQTDIDISHDFRFHGEMLFAKTEVDQLAYSPSYPPVQGPLGPGSSNAFLVPRSNPGFEDFLAQTFPATSPANFAGYAAMLLGRPFALGGNPLDPSQGAARGAAENEAFRLSAGLEKDFTDHFRAQFYTTFFRSQRMAYGPAIVGGRLQAALEGFGGPDCTGSVPGANGCLYFNPFINSSPGNPALGLENPAYVPGNENDPALVNWLTGNSGADGTEEQLILDLIFSGDTELAIGEGIDFGYAFGAQYRESNFHNEPLNKFSDPDAVPCAVEGDFSCLDDPNDTNFPTGPFIFLGQYPREDLKQDVYAVFAEGVWSFEPGIDVTLAARYEDYGDPVGSTFNPKLSVRWQANDFLALRGSVGTTFRGPLAGDLTPGGYTGVAGIDAAGGAFKATEYAGNPGLDPEEALTSNIGVLITHGGFNLSVDYWAYDFEGRFTDLPFQAIANAVSGGPGDGTAQVDCSSPFADFIIFDGGCTQGVTIANDIARIRTQTVNGPDVDVKGIDISGDYTFEASGADITLGLNATYIDEYSFSDFEYQGLTFSEGYDAVGYANYDRAPGTVSEWRGNAFARASFRQFDFGYYLRYIGGVSDNRCPSDSACTSTPEFGPTDFGREVDDYLQHDLSVSYTTRLQGAETILRLGVENVTDEDPSAARLELSYDPYIGNPLGRVIKLSTTLRF